ILRPSRHATPALCHPIPPNPSAVLLPQVTVVAACNSFLPRRLNYSETGENESNFTSFDTDFLGSCHGAIRNDSALFNYRITDYSLTAIEIRSRICCPNQNFCGTRVFGSSFSALF